MDVHSSVIHRSPEWEMTHTSARRTGAAECGLLAQWNATQPEGGAAHAALWMGPYRYVGGSEKTVTGWEKIMAMHS